MQQNHRFKEGNGWRLGFDPSREIYQGLVGGNDWALELTTLEFQDFCRLLIQLDENLQAIAEQLMAEEKIICAVESDLVWLEAEGEGDRYSLRLILNQGRGCEGNWPETVVSELVTAIAFFSVF